MKVIDIMQGRGGNKDTSRTGEENIVEEHIEQPIAPTRVSSARAAVSTALDNLPTWLDYDKTEAANVISMHIY